MLYVYKISICMENNQFGVRLREERKRLNLSQGELSVVMGVSRSAVASYEAGLTSADLSAMFKAMEHNLDVWYVLTGTRSKEVAAELMDWSLLEKILQGVREWSAEQGIEIPTDKEVALLRLLYQQAAKTQNMDPAMLSNALKLAA